MTSQNAIEEILDRFNFEKVHAYMKLVGWTYASDDGSTPTLEQLKDTARAVLFQACSPRRACPLGHRRLATGGFEARIDAWESGQPKLSLKFSIESKESGYIHDLIPQAA
jgi:hypothetical protein